MQLLSELRGWFGFSCFPPIKSGEKWFKLTYEKTKWNRQLHIRLLIFLGCRHDALSGVIFTILYAAVFFVKQSTNSSHSFWGMIFFRPRALCFLDDCSEPNIYQGFIPPWILSQIFRVGSMRIDDCCPHQLPKFHEQVFVGRGGKQQLNLILMLKRRHVLLIWSSWSVVSVRSILKVLYWNHFVLGDGPGMKETHGFFDQ